MASLGTLELGTYTNVSSTTITGSDPVLESIAGTDDADYVSDATNSTHTGTARFTLGDTPADLGNVDTVSINLRYAFAAGTQVNLWDSLTAQIVESDGSTPLTDAVTIASDITTTTLTDSGAIALTNPNTSANKETWDAALVLINWNITRVKGGDTIKKNVYAAEVTGTYTAAAPVHAATGALVGPGSAVDGTAARTRVHATTGALAGPGSVVTGSAERIAGTVTHEASGTLVGPGSVVEGAAVYNALHAVSGALVGPGAVIEGASARTRQHATSGALTGPGTVVDGAAVYNALHASTGALVGQGSVVAGTSARTRQHATTGVLAGPGASVAGTSVHNRPHATDGVLVGPGAEIAGAAARSSGATSHDTSGALAGPGAVIAGTGARTLLHVTTGALTGPGSSIEGTSARTRQHLTAGELIAQGSIIVGAADSGVTNHAASGALIGPGAVIVGYARDLFPHDVLPQGRGGAGADSAHRVGAVNRRPAQVSRGRRP